MDLKQSIAWAEKAAQQGHLYAQSELGSYYSPEGVFTTEDSSKANFWFSKAFPRLQEKADQGDAYALYILATMYNYGQYVKEDKQKAKQLKLAAYPLLIELAEKGALNAQMVLTVSFFDEMPSPIDADIPIKYIKILADQGSSLAQSFLGRILLVNDHEDEEGIALLRQAVSKGCANAALILLVFHYYEINEVTNKELETYLKLAEDQCFNLKALVPENIYANLQKLKRASASGK